MTTDQVDKEALKRDRAPLVAALREAGCTMFNGPKCCCPFHADKHPSASIGQKDGVWLFNCFVCHWGGDVFAVQARARGVPVAEVLPNAGASPANRPVRRAKTVQEIESLYPALEAIYRYCNPATKAIEMIVVRYRPPGESKRFSQWRPAGGDFENAAPPAPRPLYNRFRLASCDSPVIVEGEKKVEALHALGIVATTSPCGALSAAMADWSLLDGKKRVTIWRDNDESGLKYQEAVSRILSDLPHPPPIHTVQVEALDIPEGGDCVDFIEHWGEGDRESAVAAVRMAIETAATTGPRMELDTLIEDIIAGRKESLTFPWIAVTALTQALIPGNVTTICGDPESGKSFFLLDAIRHWATKGFEPAVYELEDERSHYSSRLLAMIAGESRMTDYRWIRENPVQARQVSASVNGDIEKIGRCITTSPDKMIRLPEINDWIDTQAKNGKKIICVDPITAADSGATPWIADREFLIRAKSTIRRYGARLLLVTHPRVGVNVRPGLASLAGGAAYSRFSHVVLWMIKHQPKSVRVRTPLGMCNVEINRTLRIAKARHASGGGLDIAFHFDPQTLRFAEQGIILGEDNASEAD